MLFCSHCVSTGAFLCVACPTGEQYDGGVVLQTSGKDKSETSGNSGPKISDKVELGHVSTVDNNLKSQLFDSENQSTTGANNERSGRKLFRSGYTNQRNPYSYRKRRKRSFLKAGGPYKIELGDKNKPHTRVIQFVPILKGLSDNMEYRLEYGNTKLFRLGHNKSGHIYIETLDTLGYGVYNLWVTGKFKETRIYSNTSNKLLEERYGDYNFKARIIVKVK